MTNNVVDTEKVTNDFDDFVMEFIVNIIMYLYVFGAIAVAVWFLVAKIPVATYHYHEEQCYSADGSLSCGKEDGELYLIESPIPTPMDVLSMLK